MDDHPILTAHAAELDPAYAALAAIADAAHRAEAVRLLDFLGNEQIAFPPGIEAWPGAIAHLGAAVEAAHPDRKSIALLAANFGKWMSFVVTDSITAFAEGLAPLAPALNDLGPAGMEDVIAAVNRDPRTMPFVTAYAMTTKAVILAAAKLAAGPAPMELLQRLAGALTLEKMEHNKDAERLLPAIAAAPETLPVAVALAERNLSSAYGTVTALPKAMRGLPDPAPYLDGFRDLADTIGISAAGFCLNTLPGIYQQQGPERAGEFVRLAAACARRYGIRAGQAFLEGKTQAARQALNPAG